MATDGFGRALARALVHEGGYVNHPRDPGGVTLEGVIQRTYDAYRRRHGLKAKPLTPAMRGTAAWNKERDAIYRAQYWDVIRGDQLPPGVDYVVFDGAVNSGPRQSVKWLQRALTPIYQGKIDGVIGEQTLDALRRHNNHDAVIRAIGERRMAFLRALKTWSTFGKGWKARVEHVVATGQAWAMGDTGPKIVYIPGAEKKAELQDRKKAPGSGTADGATGGGLVIAGGTQAIKETIDGAKDQLQPVADAIPWVGNAVAALTILGVVVVIGGIAYRIYAKRKAKKLADALDLEEAPA